MLCSFFLDPEDVRSVILGITRYFSKGTVLPCLGNQITERKGPVKKKACVHQDRKGSNPFSILFYPTYIGFMNVILLLSDHRHVSATLWPSSGW